MKILKILGQKIPSLWQNLSAKVERLIEELFLDSKSGVFELAVRPRGGFLRMGTRTKTEESKIRDYAPRTPKASQSSRTFVFGGSFSCFVCHNSWYGSSIKWT